MGIMYFKPTKEQIEAAKNSPCPLATPFDSGGCIGSRCHLYNGNPKHPCEGYKSNNQKDGNSNDT